MTQRRSSTSRFLLVAAVASLASAGAPRAQAPTDVHVSTSEGVDRIRLSLAPFTGDSQADLAVRTTVRDDLAFWGRFELLAPGDAAEYELSGLIESTGDDHVVTVTLHQAEDARVVVAKRLRGTTANLRRIGHRISDEVVRYFTGREGPFDTRIAFVKGQGGQRDIHVMDYDGRNVTRVTADGALVLSPEVSADGSLLLFTSYVSRQPAVYVIRRETGEIRRVFNKEGLNQSPTFSPDGTRVALSAAFEGNSEIYSSDLAGTNLRRLTTNPAIDVSPAWSPTGQEMAFVSDRGGTPQVYLMTADGLDVRRLTLQGDYNTDPAWSPDGSRLAYASRQGGRFQIAVLDLATNVVTLATEGSGNNEMPAWSPDGEFLAFASSREGSYDIWITRRDGSGARRVGGGGVNRFPSWYR